jgi:hypothetical protein
MRRRLAVAAAATLALAAPAAAPAAAGDPLQLSVVPAEQRFGDPHHVAGRLTDAAGAPSAARRVSILARDWPLTGKFRPIASARTDADGRFAVDDILLDRNADVRAVAFDGTRSGIARAWTYPAFNLRYKTLAGDRVRITQSYRTPAGVRLTAPTLFYVGPAAAASGPVRARAKPNRTAAGRFVATATVRLPKSWNGRFRYASCFGYSKGSGMGDPARGCPKRFAF